jgi:2,4-dienoyl-CoA reductase (NADPH2)
LRFRVAALKEFMEFFPLEQRYGLTQRFLKQANKWLQGMTAAEREQVIAAFSKAAQRAHCAGFDMVELHGANGYLICQFLSGFSNYSLPRIWEDFDQRTTFPLAVVASVKQHVPDDFPVGFRLILEEWVPNGIDLQQALRFARILEKAGIAYLSASAGTFNSIFRKDIHQRMARPAYLQQEVAKLHHHVHTPVIIAGRIFTPGQAGRLIENNTTDLIGLGRVLRVEPDWVRKARQFDRRIRTCINCLGCLRQVVLDKGFICQRWPEIERQRTSLAHQLQQRNDAVLCVAAGRKDLAPLKTVLSLLSTGPDRFPPAVLWTAGGNQYRVTKMEKQAFCDWIQQQHPGRRPVPCLWDIEPSSPEQQVLAAVAQNDYGVVLLPRHPAQPWRTRLCFQIRNRVVALAGASSACKRLLVAVDLSEATLLILSFLKAIVPVGSAGRLKLVHIVRQRDASVLAKWDQMKMVCGLESHNLALDIIETDRGPAEAISEIARKRAFDTVIMGKRGLSGLKRVLLGSVSAKVLKALPNQTLFFID